MNISWHPVKVRVKHVAFSQVLNQPRSNEIPSGTFSILIDVIIKEKGATNGIFKIIFIFFSQVLNQRKNKKLANSAFRTSLEITVKEKVTYMSWVPKQRRNEEFTDYLTL